MEKKIVNFFAFQKLRADSLVYSWKKLGLREDGAVR